MSEIQQQTSKKVYTKADYLQDPIWLNFINSLRTEASRINYSQYLIKHFLSVPPNNTLSLSEILQKDRKVMEQEIINTIMTMRNVHGLSYYSTLAFLCAITHFLDMNDFVFNKKKVNKFRGDIVSKYEYRGYTHEEIKGILSVCDDRGKTIILLMASTGMRVGALPEIKLKHLKRWNIDSSSRHIYQIKVYANSPKYRYNCYTTPEAAEAIDRYLEQRKRCGDNIKQDTESGNWLPSDSFLIIQNFSKENYPIIPRPTVAESITKFVREKLEETGQRTKKKLVYSPNKKSRYSEAGRHRNEIHPCHSLRIFAVTNMQRAKIDKTIREMLVGHSTGLDKAYYKPQDDEILQEYLKAVDMLTINNEFRLQKQVDYYKQRENDLSYMSKELAEIKEKLGI